MLPLSNALILSIQELLLIDNSTQESLTGVGAGLTGAGLFRRAGVRVIIALQSESRTSKVPKLINRAIS